VTAKENRCHETLGSDSWLNIDSSSLTPSGGTVRDEDYLDCSGGSSAFYSRSPCPTDSSFPGSSAA